MTYGIGMMLVTIEVGSFIIGEDGRRWSEYEINGPCFGLP
jgi:hypothetical protein